jgi:acyl-CoA thioesterase-1
MDFGVARAVEDGAGTCVRAIRARGRSLFLIVAFVLSGPVAALPADEPAASPLSPQCEVPSADLAMPAPLANFAAALGAGRPIRILAVGAAAPNPIGSASGVKSYPAQLTGLLEAALKSVDVDIVNRSVAGEVADTTANRIRSEVALGRPDLVLWQLGTNDALSRVEPADFEATVRGTLEWLKADHIDVVLVGLQYASQFAKDDNFFAIRDTLKRIASDENVLYVRRYEAMQFIARAHATPDAGSQCTAEHVAHAVIANLFVKRFRPGATP